MLIEVTTNLAVVADFVRKYSIHIIYSECVHMCLCKYNFTHIILLYFSVRQQSKRIRFAIRQFIICESVSPTETNRPSWARRHSIPISISIKANIKRVRGCPRCVIQQ